MRFFRSLRIRFQSAADREWAAREAEAARLLQDYRIPTMALGSRRQPLAAQVPTVMAANWRALGGGQ